MDRHTWRIKPPQRIVAREGEPVGLYQVLASAPLPYTASDLICPAAARNGSIARLLTSRERTLRFTGAKLARLLRNNECGEIVEQLFSDSDEDLYVRLEAAAYLASVLGQSARTLFSPYLTSTDEQTQLEAVISLGETANTEAVQILCEILDSQDQPYFLRSAAAWCLSRMGGEQSTQRLIRAFTDMDQELREEALEGLVTLGGPAIPALLENLRLGGSGTAAGCAEALRQQPLPGFAVAEIIRDLYSPEPSPWAVWLAGNLPREQIAGAIAELQKRAPQLHYAISLLWSFIESWIIRRWEFAPRPLSQRIEGRTG